MKISAIGIDLAKNVFQIHGVDEQGKKVLARQVRRAQMKEFFANTPPCLVGMEACGSAHFWARVLGSYGHEVRLMAPQFVKPYLKGQKNDANDAAAICEAVLRPNMRFVALKSVQQQSIACLHRVRSGWVKARTAASNQIRGLLGEFGVVVPQGAAALRERLPEELEDASNELGSMMRTLLQELMLHLKALDARVLAMDEQLRALGRSLAPCQRLQQIPGIGPVTATALVASVGDGSSYDSARQLSAAVGIVPAQHSSGGKSVLLGITKRGDAYLRYLLIHGARAVIKSTMRKKPEHQDPWIAQMLQRKHPNVVAVALASRNARVAWALLRYGRHYEVGHRHKHPLKHPMTPALA